MESHCVFCDNITNNDKNKICKSCFKKIINNMKCICGNAPYFNTNKITTSFYCNMCFHSYMKNYISLCIKNNMSMNQIGFNKFMIDNGVKPMNGSNNYELEQKNLMLEKELRKLNDELLNIREKYNVLVKDNKENDELPDKIELIQKYNDMNEMYRNLYNYYMQREQQSKLLHLKLNEYEKQISLLLKIQNIIYPQLSDSIKEIEQQSNNDSKRQKHENDIDERVRRILNSFE